MPRLRPLLPMAVAAALLPGCAYLHHPEKEKLAKQADTAFSEANIVKSLEAERAALLTQQQTRQDLVRQSQLALRDTALATVINKPDSGALVSALQGRVNDRLKKLRGAPPVRTAQGCAPLLKDVRADYGDAVSKAAMAADALRLVLAGKQGKVELSCQAIPTQLPVSLQSPINQALAQAYDSRCGAVVQQAACLREFASGGGEMGQLGSMLDAIAAEQVQAARNAAAAQAVYEGLLAEAASAAPHEGEARKAAEQLQQALQGLEQVRTKADTLAGDAILSHLADQGKVAALEEKKAVLDAYVAALGGDQPAHPSLAQYRLYLIANLLNRGTEKAAPPTAGILMQAEFYRLQLAALKLRIARGKQAVQLLEQKRQHQQDELQELQVADTYLKEANCSAAAAKGALPAAEDACSHRLASALRSFALSWTLGRLPAEQVDYRIIDLNEMAALDESQTALQQTDATVKAALAQVVKLHEAGLKPEQISNLWQALGLTAIAVRVN